MQNSSQCQEKTQGLTGKWHTYYCRVCGLPFKTDTRLTPLPEDERVCHHCKDGYSYEFVDTLTGETVVVKACFDAEMATLRAWKINKNLKFKVPQSGQGK